MGRSKSAIVSMLTAGGAGFVGITASATITKGEFSYLEAALSLLGPELHPFIVCSRDKVALHKVLVTFPLMWDEEVYVHILEHIIVALERDITVVAGDVITESWQQVLKKRLGIKD